MTNGEAIIYLNEFILFKKISNTTEEEAVECFKLAVEALQEYQHYKDLAESYEKTINKLTKAIAEPQTDKALNLLAEWAIECGFGFDNIPEEYEKYKDDIEKMGYREGLVYIVKKESEAKE